MRVLILAQSDWAYVGYTLSRCLRVVGVEADMMFKNLRGNRRPNCGIHFTNVNQVKKYAERADIIQFMQGQWVNTGVDLSKKRVFVFYGGTNYRVGSGGLNTIFNPIVEKSIIQTGDLFGLGAKSEVWLLPAVDLDLLRPNYKRHSGKLIIGHMPSSSIKGPDINKVIAKLKSGFGDKFDYITSTNRVSWPDNLKRVSECDIYIESCALKQKFKDKLYKTGEWGVSALEAAALGDVVVASFLSSDKYKLEYGSHEIQVSNTLYDLENVLTKLLSLTDNELLNLKKKTRAWVEQFHSFEAVGRRLKEKIYEI